ncbi:MULTISPECIES: DEAD/DEAH box helicase [Gordonia]|nr:MULTISPECIES: DEAD/DEAH box helicase [Gordonia]OBC04897.1 helicase SNF2 [Gordonia sp. 852002-50816_SCH5313054-a]NKY95885.1 DEAD/DEAH box helicase [Gordonia sputi]OBA36460.1 helicase SNF2 [Gordonia sp. 852002-51296_SCH5728562-b]OBA71785.1 helicase SNF2 [Gordonia sp. 852002-10350_SCH5691597]OBC04731.1 helicase SNF2 [Gordonia sp. 852002-50395_SCH5434458]
MSRGEAYSRQSMVRSYNWVEGDRVLAGTCQGSGGRHYAVRVHFTERPPTMAAFSHGNCTCPVGIDCKHAVAVLLTASSPGGQGSLTRDRAQRHLRAVPPPQPPSWRNLLAGVTVETSTPVQPAGVPLALSFRQATPTKYSLGPSLQLRPMLMGRQGRWIKTGATWREVISGYNTSSLKATHAGAIRALHQAITGHSYATSSDWLSMAAANHVVWDALRSVRDAGVEMVVDAVPGAVEVELTTASLRYDIEANPDGAALRCGLAIDGELIGDRLRGYIGRDVPSGVWLVGDRVLSLAGFDPPLVKAEVDLLAHNSPVLIPHEDLDEFAVEVVPRIEQRRAVRVADGVLTPPDVSGPFAVLTLTDSGGNYRYGWSVGYQVNDRRHVFDVAENVGATPYRDVSAESELWESLREPMQEVVECIASWFSKAWTAAATQRSSTVRDLQHAFEQASLAGQQVEMLPAMALATAVPITSVDAALLVATVLPDLAGDERIVIDNRIAVDFRQLDDEPSISFTADDSTGNDWFGLGVTVTVGDHQVPTSRLISELSSGATHLILDDGSYFSLDVPELRRLAELIAEARALGEIENGKVSARSMNATLWEELLELGVVDKQIAQWRAQMAKLAALTPPKRVACPRTLKAKLRDYQRDGLNWLAFLSDNNIGGILADDMGLGKTIQTLAMITRVVKSTPQARYLVVAPTSVVPNWVAEAGRFAPSLTVSSVVATPAKSGIAVSDAAAGANIVVTSYTLMRLLFDDLDALRWDGIIFDEAQFIKNHTGKTHQAARRLEAPSKIAITGTPMENNLMELWALLSVTAPGLFPSPTAFTEYFRKPIESGAHPERMETLRRRIKPIMLRRKKEQVALDLPAKQEQVLALELNSRHRRIYDTRLTRERQKVLGLLGDWEKNRFQVFRSLSLLRQLSLHAGLVDGTHSGVASAKVEYLMEALPELVAEGHSALVFSQFTGFLDIIRAHLDDAELAYSYLDGSMTANARAQAVDQFTSGATQIFLISLKAGGFGLNLTEADYCFVCDPWWNPAAEAQAVDRAHRIGQQRPVTVCRLVSANTIEERVVGLQDRKRALFDAAIDDGELFGTALSSDDIREMLG